MTASGDHVSVTRRAPTQSRKHRGRFAHTLDPHGLADQTAAPNDAAFGLAAVDHLAQILRERLMEHAAVMSPRSRLPRR